MLTFNLAENQEDPEHPFAFMVTLSDPNETKAKHLPLMLAMQAVAKKTDKPGAVGELLAPLHRLAARSEMVKELLVSKSIFTVSAWTPNQALAFLHQTEIFEEEGVRVRVPNWWDKQRPAKPRVTIELGTTKPQRGIGMNTLLSFSVHASLHGEKLSSEEWRALLASSEQLVRLRGHWVEVDPTRLRQAMDKWQIAEVAMQSGMSFNRAMQLLLGLPGHAPKEEGIPSVESSQEIVEFKPGEWLRATFNELNESRDKSAATAYEKTLQAVLRSYQQAGVSWLWRLYQLGFGGCLADDMGLGKTIQVIAFLLQLKADTPESKRLPSILVVPASLLGNWYNEISRFAPSLAVTYFHRAFTPELNRRIPDSCDLVVTTYAYIARYEFLRDQSWCLVILDEAQAIKNPQVDTTQLIKKLRAEQRIALTGTPIENKLTDLWSIMDFCNPGLLGTLADFKRMTDDEEAKLRLKRLIQPFVLRRMKTDRRIITDLPSKTEYDVYCGLTVTQAMLYEKTVKALAAELANQKSDDPARRVTVFKYLLHFKQICNHPALYQGTLDYDPGESGKFLRLERLASEIRDRGEKLLVFSQFESLCHELQTFLEKLWQQSGLKLTGKTPVKQRREIVRFFQEREDYPFLVLSLKAGGTGLNLTRACHVLHFDRWWNPAIEAQATDRAFRIGQKQPVLVHKMICSGTIEERIASLLKQKSQLAQDMLGEDSDAFIMSKLNDQELIALITLNRGKALAEIEDQ